MMADSLLVPAIFLLGTIAAGTLLLALFQPRLDEGRRLRRRIELVAGPPRPATQATAPAEAGDAAQRRRAVEASLRELEEKQKAVAQRRSKPSLAVRIRQAGLAWTPRTYHMAGAMAGAAGFLLAFLLFGTGLLPALGFGMAAFLLAPHLYVKAKRASRFKSFGEEFPNALDVIVRGVKSGLPLAECLKIIASETQEPVKGEFKEILEDQTLGMPLDEAVQRLAERMPVTEANFFAIVIAIQSRTGGSLSEALGNLSRVLRERKKMHAKIKAMSSEAKSSAFIIGSLPIIVGFLVYMVSPDYILLLFTTMIGNLVLGASALWMLMGIMVMRRMINFDF